MSTSTNDLDPHLIKCIGLLYESRNLRKGDPVPLQYILEESIFQKTGVVKDYTDFFQSQLPAREIEEPVTIYDDNDSDNDLELDLFKDDLSCVVCSKMDVGARNRLLECTDCHGLYHQECHKPVVSEEDVTENWTCSSCKSISSSKKMKTSEKDHGSKASTSKSDSSSLGLGSSHRSSSSHKSSSDKYKSSSKSSSSKSSSSPSHSRSEDKKSSKSKSSKYYSEKRKHD